MKTGYKIFIISNIVGVTLEFMSVKLPPVIETVLGLVVGAALLHAFFIAKSPKSITPGSTTNNETYAEYQDRIYHARRKGWIKW